MNGNPQEDRSTADKMKRKEFYRFTENSIVVWLVSPEKEVEESLIVKKLSQDLGRSIEIFIDRNECLDFILEIQNEKVCLILSHSSSEEIVPLIHTIDAIHSIYLFSHDNSAADDTSLLSEEKFWKVNNISNDLSKLTNDLKKTFKFVDDLFLPTIFLQHNDRLDVDDETSEDKLDAMFMYLQLLKETSLEINHNEKEAKDKFVEFCKQEKSDDANCLEKIDEFSRTYTKEKALWWYTLDSFLYRMLNKCLRMNEIAAINKFGFFIKDLHLELEKLQTLNPKGIYSLYRGQGMYKQELEQLKQNIGRLMSFNCFLSTTADRRLAEFLAESNTGSLELEGVFFVINVDSNVMISSPFAALEGENSHFPEEQEYLWGMNTVFRINAIQQLDSGCWQVNLSVTSNDDPQLKDVTDHMREAIASRNGDFKLAQLMIRMGEFEQAKEIYEKLLAESDKNDVATASFLYHQLGYVTRQLNHFDDALEHYRTSLALDLTRMSDDDQRLVTVYSNIATIIREKGDLDQALEQYQRALKIEESAKDPNDRIVTGLLQNIGSILQERDRFADALNVYMKIGDIQELYLPPMHPDHARTYNSIGSLLGKMGASKVALDYFTDALKIQERSLPENHIELAIIHSNMADCLTALVRPEQALEHAKKARDIAEQTLPADHPDIQEFETMCSKIQSILRLKLS